MLTEISQNFVFITYANQKLLKNFWDCVGLTPLGSETLRENIRNSEGFGKSLNNQGVRLKKGLNKWGATVYLTG